MNKKGTAARLNDGLRKELSKFPKNKVDAFVRSVGSALGTNDIFTRQSETERRKELSQLRSVAQKFLETATHPVMARPFPVRMDSATELPRTELEKFYGARDAAHRAVAEYLREIDLAIALNSNLPRSRPPADKHGLLARIARRYLEVFEIRPKSTPGGTFANIAALVLENAYGNMPVDVSRQVRAAIKNL